MILRKKVLVTSWATPCSLPGGAARSHPAPMNDIASETFFLPLRQAATAGANVEESHFDGA
jgi:hypothetical protein